MLEKLNIVKMKASGKITLDHIVMIEGGEIHWSQERTETWVVKVHHSFEISY